jgi:predicted house-cleaning NTP pyrophosphatase (Maf/HAM1 superfamily)
MGGLLVESVHGSYDNVVGLPLRLLYRLMRRQGIDIWSAITS